MYPRMDQVKFMEDSLMVEDSDKVYLLISIPPLKPSENRRFSDYFKGNRR